MSYSYSYLTDFGSSLNESQFHREIVENNEVKPPLTGISRNGDVITVVFITDLNVEEKTTLDGLVISHTPDNIIRVGLTQTMNVKNVEYKNSNYTKVISFSYMGSNFAKTIKSAKCMSYGDSGTTYSVRLFDVTNDKQIAEATFNNTINKIEDLGVINNIPLKESILEFQIKKVTGLTEKIIHIEEVSYFS
jgi:hypothetical protein